ncbi:hypothetical protein GUITHDRAFT_134069 [Guillardia theta CCMP2712]|uniref:Uncharacterized protein n=1 Tax=Guillardia theta (strain CCMP2712) TaxID=905079 RepID=L1JTD5_GUITC|nr:hypothetical protein GUITHDRAFT_134069 [Guillardia theta CCMP2712]EKX51697.1 hypothetical protein GUITHDRAFT_134069 [Guillardia theta CCMP2712]|eukprot:XP_005838677.1 hypothetical protein GUITHDRAFT_134069 [Guillardia theta CCMP2712]
MFWQLYCHLLKRQWFFQLNHRPSERDGKMLQKDWKSIAYGYFIYDAANPTCGNAFPDSLATKTLALKIDQYASILSLTALYDVNKADNTTKFQTTLTFATDTKFDVVVPEYETIPGIGFLEMCCGFCEKMLASEMCKGDWESWPVGSVKYYETIQKINQTCRTQFRCSDRQPCMGCPGTCEPVTNQQITTTAAAATTQIIETTPEPFTEKVASASIGRGSFIFLVYLQRHSISRRDLIHFMQSSLGTASQIMSSACSLIYRGSTNIEGFAGVTTLQSKICGDGKTQTDTGEECDDGNQINGVNKVREGVAKDGCSQSCQVEYNWHCWHCQPEDFACNGSNTIDGCTYQSCMKDNHNYCLDCSAEFAILQQTTLSRKGTESAWARTRGDLTKQPLPKWLAPYGFMGPCLPSANSTGEYGSHPTTYELNPASPNFPADPTGDSGGFSPELPYGKPPVNMIQRGRLAHPKLENCRNSP